MNLGLFNRMNIKDSASNKGMYSEWTSLTLLIQNYGEENKSVLEKFGLLTSKEVTLAIVKQLVSNLGITHSPEESPLVSDKEVQWCMEVICFGLSLPLLEHESIKDCVNVYCEWLTALLPTPKICVPKPIIDDPNIYCQKIISHFYYLFIPRKGEGLDTINRQAVLCHRVLRTLKQIANDSKILDRETWECLLLFLIAINDNLLALPTVKEDIADQLCERTLSVLFEVWLIACAHSFPSPTLWKTLRECCMNWRHRTALVEQWNRVNLALTSKILVFMYGPTFPELKLGDDDIISHPMNNDCIAQSWYRFLNIIGNPVCLTKPEVISQTQKFLHFAINNTDVMDPCQHPCLEVLPQIFLKAIKGIAGQVDAFLGAPKTSLIGLTTSRTSIPNATSGSSGPSSSTSLSSLTSINLEPKPTLAPARPKCNSILHLFGEWLFDAAYIDTDCHSRQFMESNKRMSSVIIDKKSSISFSQSSSLSDMPSLPPALMIDKFEGGKAEALGTLCRIICSKKTGEEILPMYLARFYMAVQVGLKVPPNRECTETMVAILMNSSDLFRLDLDGVRMLMPVFISALEIVLPEKDLKLNASISKVELRRACINILLSMLILPLHFQNVAIKDLINTGFDKPVAFIQLKLRLMNLLMNALQIETDAQNTHMLLGGLFLSVLDSATYERVEQFTQPPAEAGSNLLSSASDTASTASMASSFDHTTPSLETIEPVEPYEFHHQLSIDSAHALFVRATYLVCHRLISSWKTDLNISLAALELLSGLARIHIKESDAMECKRAVKWLCDYIIHQCSRPPPGHSKDLHSTIVAAFHCCSVWLLQHPYLLRDKDCLQTVLEVVELGVSGTKSIGKPSENIKMKEDKELKPVSIRVRDAAENLLTCILEDVGYFPNECGPESTSSLLDEVTLLQYCNPSILNKSEKKAAVQHFRYFVSEGGVMLALLEDPLGNDQDPQPTVTLLIRGPFGRHAWTMQLRHLPRHKSSMKYHAPNPCRPVAMQDGPARPTLKQKYFPDSVDRVQHCKVDLSIPSLESVLAKDASISEDAEKLKQYLGKQSSTESNLGSNCVFQECMPPPVCHDYQTARLFLSHFGLLELDIDEEDDAKTGILELDSSLGDFSKDLTLLDDLSPRTCDTVHIFYVKSQQNKAEDIVGNMRNQTSLSPYYIEFLHTLGWAVDIGKHPGWTGHISTSWKLPHATEQKPNDRSTQEICYDGTERVLYWADACSEIAFIVPSQLKAKHSGEHPSFNANILSWCDGNPTEVAGRDKRALSLDLDKQPMPPKRSSHRSSMYTHTNSKIMVVWLENFEDHLNLPISDLLNCMNTGLENSNSQKNTEVTAIFLHAMETGLFRVHLQGPAGKVGLALPLINGMVVNRRCLGPLVRYTSLNMARRRRLDSENYQPPHVRRRVKIQEMVQKYKRNMSRPELLTNLFRAM
ncbi:ral GTPase-activating protein subunit beta isoform X2 [Coccinella septempunctata]|uniref:ral GTPase-activating protein subunit beta isoform X2 n=1 Tax=Coccinella septempunctata TaxID=41139 RepID=UPI001D07D844|nr:ral GTPase-activating protein subunit beta isoform X2 [Coccinella septempunctata]